MCKEKERLIIVEGLPSAGKSTTARFLAAHCGMTCVDEGTGHHPADWENHALLDEDTFRQAVSLLGDDEDAVRAFCSETEYAETGYFVPVANWLPDAVRALLMQYKIYDVLPWAKQRSAMLEKWHMFAENIGSERYVFNCVLLQNPMCETMMRFNQTQGESAAFIGEIAEIIRPLDPLVVYLQTGDIAACMQRVLTERGTEWLSAVTDYHCGSAYGKANGLHGFDGYIAALRERQRRELAILAALPLRSIVLSDPQNDWDAAYRTLTAQL